MHVPYTNATDATASLQSCPWSQKWVVLTLTAIVTSPMLNSAANVKKNWLNAAHFHCRLRCKTSSEKRSEVGGAGDDA
jgi:hypothetical protein